MLLNDMSTTPFHYLIPSDTSYSGKISSTLSLDQVYITPTIPFPIVSVPSLCSDNKLVLFSPTSATIIPKNDLIISKFNSCLDFASTHYLIMSAPLDPTEILYKLLPHHLANIPVINNLPKLPFSLHSVHRYSTIKTRTIAEDIDMVQRLFGHCDAETLISLSSPPSECNILAHLSAASIRKHFQFSCPDCPLGNLQHRKSQYSAPSEPSTIGVEWEVDFKGKCTGPDDRPSPTFQQQQLTLLRNLFSHDYDTTVFQLLLT